MKTKMLLQIGKCLATLFLTVGANTYAETNGLQVWYVPDKTTILLGEPLLGTLSLTNKDDFVPASHFLYEVWVGRQAEGSKEEESLRYAVTQTAPPAGPSPRDGRSFKSRTLSGNEIPGLYRSEVDPSLGGEKGVENFLFPSPGVYSLSVAVRGNRSPPVRITVKEPTGTVAEAWAALPKRSYVRVGFAPHMALTNDFPKGFQKLRQLPKPIEELRAYLKKFPNAPHSHWVVPGVIEYSGLISSQLTSTNELKQTLTELRQTCDNILRQGAITARLDEVSRPGFERFSRDFDLFLTNYAARVHVNIEAPGESCLKGRCEWKALDIGPDEIAASYGDMARFAKRHVSYLAASVEAPKLIMQYILADHEYELIFTPDSPKYAPVRRTFKAAKRTTNTVSIVLATKTPPVDAPQPAPQGPEPK